MPFQEVVGFCGGQGGVGLPNLGPVTRFWPLWALWPSVGIPRCSLRESGLRAAPMHIQTLPPLLPALPGWPQPPHTLPAGSLGQSLGQAPIWRILSSLPDLCCHWVISWDPEYTLAPSVYLSGTRPIGLLLLILCLRLPLAPKLATYPSLVPLWNLCPLYSGSCEPGFWFLAMVQVWLERSKE